MKLLVLLSLLVTRAWGVIPGTEGLYFTTANVLADASGKGRTLTQVGTVPVNVTQCTTLGQGAGVFTDSQYAVAPAELMTAMDNLPQGSIEWFQYTFSFANQPVSWDSNALQTFFQHVTGAFPDFAYAFPSRLTSGSASTVGVCYSFAVQWDSTNIKIFRNGVEIATVASAVKPRFTTSLHLGHYTAGAGLFTNGYISNLRFSSVSRGGHYPNVDYNSNRTMDVEQILIQELEGMLRRQRFFIAAMATKGHAITQDQRVEQAMAKSLGELQKRRISPTPVPTLTPTLTRAQLSATKSPTPRPTATPSPTPAKP